jgi:hypothetical protein
MSKWYFTLTLADPKGPGCIEVNGEDWQNARQRMISKYGLKWAFQYESLDKVNKSDREILDSF